MPDKISSPGTPLFSVLALKKVSSDCLRICKARKPVIRVDLESRKRRRLEIFHFSSASAPNLLDAINHVEVTVQKNGADALRRVKSSP